MRKRLVIMLAGALSACGSNAPSVSEAQQALLAYMRGPESKLINDERIWLMGEGSPQQYVRVKTIACQTGDATLGADCEFQYETCVGSASEGCDLAEAVKSGRFVKAEKGWKFLASDPAKAPGRPVEMIGLMMMGMITGGSGGPAGCFTPSLSGTKRDMAIKLGGKPCD